MEEMIVNGCHLGLRKVTKPLFWNFNLTSRPRQEGLTVSAFFDNFLGYVIFHKFL